MLAEDAEGGQTLIEEDKTVASIGTNITVRNKAGWIDGQDDDAVCDSGIVTINGRDYLITIMTNAPDSAASRPSPTSPAPYWKSAATWYRRIRGRRSR